MQAKVQLSPAEQAARDAADGIAREDTVSVEPIAPPQSAEVRAAPVAPSAPSESRAPEDNVAALALVERRAKLRILEALLFAAKEPLDGATLAEHLDPGEDVAALLSEIEAEYAGRGVTLVEVGGKWAFRTAGDLGYLLERYKVEERRLSRAALETLAIIAYHQPVTRAEIEEIRGVITSKGTLDVLMETGWVRPRGRRRAPGKPLTYGTSETFLSQFGFLSIKDLPGLAELKGTGLLDGNLPPDFAVPEPSDMAELMPDELPLEAEEEDEGSPDLFAREEDTEGEDAAAPLNRGDTEPPIG